MLFQKLLKPASAATGIQYVGGYTVGYTTTGNKTVSLTILTGGIATAPNIGDFVLVNIGVAYTGSVTPSVVTSGYVNIVNEAQADTNETTLYASYKILSTSETSVIVNGSILSNESFTVYISVWRNVDLVAPFDVPTTTATGASSILANPPAITPLTSGSYIVAVGAGASGSGAQTYSSSDLTDFQSVGVNNTYDSTIGGGYKQWTSGTFDPAAFTFSTSSSVSNSWVAATVALRPTGRTYPSFIDSAGDNGDGTITVPAHNAGDWLVFVNGSATSSTPPATVSGFTSLGTFANTGAGLLRSGRLQYIVSDGTITTITGSGFYANVAVLRNVTGVGATSFINTAVTTGSTTVSVGLTPTVPGSICLLGSYNGGSLTGATGVTLTTNFGGRGTTAAIPASISGTLTLSAAVAPNRFGAEFY